jgi:hypothetical protein
MNDKTMPLKRVDLILQSKPGDVSDQGLRCIYIAEQTLNLFLERNQGYGATSDHLGARGQYADMWRKMGKLKHTLWDGNEPVGEGIEEMLQDLIGHCLLTIDYLHREEDGEL